MADGGAFCGRSGRTTLFVLNENAPLAQSAHLTVTAYRFLFEIRLFTSDIARWIASDDT